MKKIYEQPELERICFQAEQSIMLGAEDTSFGYGEAPDGLEEVVSL